MLSFSHRAKRRLKWVSALLVFGFFVCSCKKLSRSGEADVFLERGGEEVLNGESDQKTVTLAYLDWPPYSSESLPSGGPHIEIVRRALAKENYDLKVLWMPWKRCVLSVNLGEVDAYGMAHYSDERNEKVYFSKECVATVAPAFYSLRHREIPYDGISSLLDLRVGAERGAYVNEAFHQAQWKDIEKISSMSQGIKMLRLGRLDLLVSYKGVLYYEFYRLYPDEKADQVFRQVGPLQSDGGLYVGFSRKVENSEKVRDAFDRGLRELKKSGEYQEILKTLKLGGSSQ